MSTCEEAFTSKKLDVCHFKIFDSSVYVHVDSSAIELGIVLKHLGEGDIDNPIAFSSRKLSYSE